MNDQTAEKKTSGWAQRLPPFILAFITWFLVVWPFGPGGWIDLQIQDLIAGLLAAFLVLLVMRDVTASGGAKWLEPQRWGWLFCYIGVLAHYIIVANLDVVYRVLHPEMPIRPGIVRVKSDLTSPTALTVLANSITLTPGTLTVNATAEGVLYVHWIWVHSDDDEAAAAYVTKRFEWFIKRIFE